MTNMGIKSTDIKVNSQTKSLTVTFSNGVIYQYPAEYLRVYSPSAEVRGHGNEPPKLIYGRIHINIMDIELVGNYAIRISFDDMHDTGIFSWEYLYELGRDYNAYWDMYNKQLSADNKFRTP